MIANAKGDEVVDEEEGRTKGNATFVRFASSVVGTAREVAEGGNQFGRTVEKGVLEKQISKEVEATSFEVRSSMDRRSWRNKQFDRMRGTTERESGEGGGGGSCRHDGSRRKIRMA